MKHKVTCLILMIALSLTGSAEAQVPQKTILALGDSITAGAPAYRSPAEAPPAGRGNPQSQYAYWIEQRFSAWKVMNRGISGQTSGQILARLERELQETQPQLVILMAGVNDIYRGYSVAELKTNLESAYQKIQAAGLPLMVLTILPYRGLTPQKAAQMDEINRWIQAYALEHQLGFCDTAQIMRSESSPPQLISSADGLHPDTAGYQRMGQAIAAALSEWNVFRQLSPL